MIKILTLIALISGFSFPAYSQSLQIRDQNGKYLGVISSNKYDLDSISNPHGEYGSKHSLNSVNNPHGPYGSRHSLGSSRNTELLSNRTSDLP